MQNSATKNKDELRNLIDFKSCICELSRIAREMKNIESEMSSLSEISMLTNKKSICDVVSIRHASLRDKLSVLKDQSTFYFRQLKFGLPELKAIEFNSAGDDANLINWVINTAPVNGSQDGD